LPLWYLQTLLHMYMKSSIWQSHSRPYINPRANFIIYTILCKLVQQQLMNQS